MIKNLRPQSRYFNPDPHDGSPSPSVAFSAGQQIAFFFFGIPSSQTLGEAE